MAMSAPPPAVTNPSSRSSGEETAPQRPWLRRLIRDELGVIAVLVVIVVGVGIAHPDFLRTGNLLSTGHNSVYVGLMACGMVFPLAMREVDLSVGGMFAMCVVVGAVLIKHGVGPWVAVAVILVLSAALGAVNGVVTTYMRLPSFIVTLATALLFRGIGLALAEGRQIGGLPEGHPLFTVVGGDLLGAPTALWVFAVAVIALTVLFTRTRFGAQVRAIGSNPEAAEFTGLPMARTRIKALALSGLMAGVSAVMSLAFFIAADPTAGQGYELTAIAAAIIGGTPLVGGRGSVVGAAVGCLILGTVTSALVFFQIPINWTTFATGAVILVAVAADALLRRVRAGRSHPPRS
jgi:ribose/xylose/arabinose/galactoside ABC-type transport system permease subunit